MVRALLFACLVAGSAVDGPELPMPAPVPATEIPAAAHASITCVYRFLKANPAIMSVDVYAVDDMRAAVEYSFRGKDGTVIVSDLQLSAFPDGVSFSGTLVHGEPDPVVDQEMDFEGAFDKELGSKCHLKSGFDDTIPFPPPRKDWHHVSPPDNAQ